MGSKVTPKQSFYEGRQSCITSFQMEIVLVSSLKYDPSQPLNRVRRKMLRFYITVEIRKIVFNASRVRKTFWHP